MTDSIPKKVIQQLGQIGTETMEKAVENAGKAGHDIITGKELLGLTPMNAGEYDQKKVKDEEDKQKKIDELKQPAVPGRNVEGEIKQVRDEKKQKEEEEERIMLENVKRQREEEEAERAQMTEVPGNAKREAAKQQFVPGPKKKTPDPSQMSQTSEFKGKID
ncbi:MAG: hypothetical protein NTY75_05250 [Candidatus Shapirobacteria bacterium]|nr:hypothetical protein [Candidatus Shapirobacteria bacterium]